MAHFGGSFQIDKKGAIDLVTEVDVAVERMFRTLIAERFPDHEVLAEGMGGAVWEADLRPRDGARASLIVVEPGGVVTATDGAAFTSRGGNVLASNGGIHDAMLDVIRRFKSAGRA